VLHEHPDHLIVWNESHAWEARTLHGVPDDRILIRGAANFDRFFDEVAALPAEPDRETPTILYLGSSKASLDEPSLFAAWLEAIRSADDALLREANVNLRPHPASV